MIKLINCNRILVVRVYVERFKQSLQIDLSIKKIIRFQTYSIAWLQQCR